MAENRMSMKQDETWMSAAGVPHEFLQRCIACHHADMQADFSHSPSPSPKNMTAEMEFRAVSVNGNSVLQHCKGLLVEKVN